MRIACFLPNHAPHFGLSWSRASSLIADVVIIEFVHEISLQRRTRFVGSDGSRYQVVRFDVRPTRLMADIAARKLARRVQTAIDLATIDHGRIDLLHTHYYHQAGFLKYLEPIPYVHTEHSSALLAGSYSDQAHFPLSQTGLRLAKQCFAEAARVIAVSRTLATSMELLDLPGVPFAVIPNPIDTKLFAFSEVRSSPNNTIVSVGRLAEDKQPNLILEAFAGALRQVPDLHLKIIGDGPLRAALVEQTRKLGISHAVSFLGQLSQEEVAENLFASTVFLHAAKMETFGAAIAEALATGTPVIAPNTSAIPELINPSNGILVEPASIRSLTQGLLQGLARKWNRPKISEDARATYSISNVATKLHGIYGTALADSKPLR